MNATSSVILKSVGISAEEPNDDEESENLPPTQCPYSVQANMQRFADRHSLSNLQKIAASSEYAGYANFDPIDHPEADFL